MKLVNQDEQTQTQTQTIETPTEVAKVDCFSQCTQISDQSLQLRKHIDTLNRQIREMDKYHQI